MREMQWKYSLEEGSRKYGYKHKKENGKNEFLRLSDIQALDIKLFCRRYNDVIVIDWITNSFDDHNYNFDNPKQTTHTK